MKRFLSVTLFAALLGAQGVANAGFYLGADYARTSFDYSDIDDASGYQIGVGYRFENNLSLEVRYLDSGEADVNGSASVDDVYPGATVSGMDLELDGYMVTAGYGVPLGASDQWELFFRGGMYDTETKASGTVTLPGMGSQRGSVSEDSTGLTLGLGIEWRPVEKFGLRASVDSLLDNEDFADDKNVTVISVGTVIRLGD